MDRLTSLTAFVRVADSGGFSAAGRKLNMSPPVVTRAINDLRADPAIRARYQFWTFQYPTGTPFIASAAQLRQALADLRAYYDPNGADPAFDQMVLVGHSMGGLIAKLQTVESADDFWKTNSDHAFADLKADPDTVRALATTYFFRPGAVEASPLLLRVVPPEGGAGFERADTERGLAPRGELSW